MKKIQAQWIILILWLSSFIYTAYVLLYKWQVLPMEYQSNLIKEMSEIYSVPIAIMLLFLYFDSKNKANQKKEISISLFVLSVILSLAYLSSFTVFLFRFNNSIIDAQDVLDAVTLIKPAFSFLVTAELAYLFGIKN